MTFAEAAFRILSVLAIVGWCFQFALWCEERPRRNRKLEEPDRTLTMSPRWTCEENDY